MRDVNSILAYAKKMQKKAKEALLLSLIHI